MGVDNLLTHSVELLLRYMMYFDIKVEVVMFGDITSCLLRGISSLLSVFLCHQFVLLQVKFLCGADLIPVLSCLFYGRLVIIVCCLLAFGLVSCHWPYLSA